MRCWEHMKDSTRGAKRAALPPAVQKASAAPQNSDVPTRAGIRSGFAKGFAPQGFRAFDRYACFPGVPVK